MTARKGERRRKLLLFLEDAFRPDNFEIVLWGSYLADIASDVNAKAAGRRYYFEIIQALEQRGRIDAAFFDLLTQERPEKAKLIAGLAKSWGVAEQRPARPSEVIRVPGFMNSLGMTLMRIEPGEFLMGSTKGQIDKLLKQFPDSKREWFDDEQPQHPVKITRPFYLAAHQVTVGQYRRFVESSGYETEGEKACDKANWRNPGFTQGDDHPVVYVTHNDAMAFLGWLAKQKNEKSRGYRLPTEAEWEYACRAGTGGLYGASDDPESLVRIANVADASLMKVIPNATCIRGDDGYAYTAPVGSFEPNAWHLHDMIGNAWEWCDDWFDPKFSQSPPEENSHSMAMASSRVIRGGCWHPPWNGRPAYRYGYGPGYRCYSLGFRVAAVQE